MGRRIICALSSPVDVLHRVGRLQEPTAGCENQRHLVYCTDQLSEAIMLHCMNVCLSHGLNEDLWISPCSNSQQQSRCSVTATLDGASLANMASKDTCSKRDDITLVIMCSHVVSVSTCSIGATQRFARAVAILESSHSPDHKVAHATFSLLKGSSNNPDFSFSFCQPMTWPLENKRQMESVGKREGERAGEERERGRVRTAERERGRERERLRAQQSVSLLWIHRWSPSLTRSILGTQANLSSISQNLEDYDR
ncbi:hypothetical protein JOB18_016326 [Solea senegalensis]|uniref:Uncharacterized protein n=1 Tax=Solea senegalensis TaxID=28829 RepID=A0AAV6T5Q2_SOLSE|nr:hypothetical protein JOB18_016326 [Solea senegalensis]